MVKIQEVYIETCVIADYKDGGKFCMAKFMHEEDARAYMKTLEEQEWLTYRLYTRYSGDEVRWKPLGEKE
jgi:hypothetical protein